MTEDNMNNAMDNEGLKAFIMDFYDAWKERNPEKVRKFYADDVKAHVDFKPVTLEDMMERLAFSEKKFSQAAYRIEDLFAEASTGKIAVRMKQHYVFRETHDTLECESITLYKIAEGKIKEIWMSFYPNVDYHDND